MTSWPDHDATSLAQAIKAHQISPREAADAAINAAEQLNPQLNAIIHERFEAARNEADTVDTSLPLGGVPIVIKDLDGTFAGLPWHGGCRHLAQNHYVPSVTSTLFERYVAAGCIIIGKTNTPEFGLVPTTEPDLYGPTRNPWNLNHSTGGSSGGSAAAVAAGIVPIGHAGDGGGSIRIPASECGLVGLKPSRNRVPLGPGDYNPWGGMVSRLGVTRTVRDTAAIFAAIADPTWRPSPTDRPLRIGLMLDAPGVPTVDSECIEAARQVAAELEHQGHHVELAAPPQVSDEGFYAELTADFFNAFAVWVAQQIADLEMWTNVAVTPDGVEPGTWAVAEMGRMIDGITFANALRGLQRASAEIRSWWDTGFDLLVTPTLPELPPELGQFSSPDDPLTGIVRATTTVAFTVPFNISGQPAISIPTAQSASGLPIGVQLVAADGCDELLIDIASKLEAALPWAGRAPGVRAASH